MNYTNTDSPNNKCSVCVLGQFCLPVGLSASDVSRVDALVKERVHLQKGESLYRHGDPLSSVYSVRFGTLKTEYCLQDGRQQVIGFHLPGEILGLDGIGEGQYQSDAIALEESEVCIIRYEAFEDLALQIPLLQQQFHRIMSREIARDYGVMLLLGSMRAEERLAAFLLNLSQRFAARGYSSKSFLLRMTRNEIGSYLGLKLETISRALSHFQTEGIIAVQNKSVEILDAGRLRAMVSQCSVATAPMAR